MEHPMPREFWQGIEQFNQGQYYECHDTLEALWLEAMEPDKTFLQGILQLAVALYHLGNHNWKGAVILLGEGQRRLGRYEPDYGGINVTQLIDDSDLWLTTLQTLGADQVIPLADQLQTLVQATDRETKPIAPALPRPRIYPIAHEAEVS